MGVWRGSRSDLNKDEPATRGAPTSRLLIGCQACQVKALGEEISAAGFTSREENYFPWGFRIYFPQEIFPRFARDYLGTDTLCNEE